MDKLREEIDLIDSELLSLIEKRVSLARKIGDLKRQTKSQILDESRESQIIESILQKAKEKNIDEEVIIKIWKLLFELSYKNEQE